MTSDAQRPPQGLPGRPQHDQPAQISRTTRRARDGAGGRYDRDDVVARTDLVELVRELSDGEGRHNGSWFMFRCLSPTHDDRTPSFGVTKRPGSRKWKCFSCGVEGSGPIDVLVQFQGMTVADAIRELGDRCGARLEVGRPTPRRDRVLTRPPEPVLRPVTQNFEDAERLRFVGEYRDRLIRARCWSDETIDAFGIELVRVRGSIRWRFPFRDGNGTPRYWQDRAVADSVTPKWTGPTGSVLVPFGADLLNRRQPNDQIVLLEGVPDVVTLVELFPAAAVIGVPGAANFRPVWLEALRADGRPVVVVADSDDAGHKMRTRVRDVLGDQARDVYVPEPHNDLGDWHVAQLHRDRGWFRQQGSARPGDVLEEYAELHAEGVDR